MKLYQGQPFFKGKNTFEAMRQLGHLIEDRLAGLIEKRSEEKIEPRRLPEVIEAEIQKRLPGASIF